MSSLRFNPGFFVGSWETPCSGVKRQSSVKGHSGTLSCELSSKTCRCVSLFAAETQWPLQSSWQGAMKLNGISHKQEQGASRGVPSKFATFVFGYIQVILGHLLGRDGYQTGVLSSNTHSAFNKGVCVSSYLTRDQYCRSPFYTLFWRSTEPRATEGLRDAHRAMELGGTLL